ncbi:site-specific DNA-methyltransferase [Aerococcus mictus]
MTNLSQEKRQKMLDYIAQLKEIHNDDESIIALNNIENALTEKKYGLVWEEHSEKVDEMLEHHIPVFEEVEEKKIENDSKDGFNFLLEGDNLHSLKLLEKTHREKIDVIYIDPPYNTSNSLTYNDHRVSSEDGYRHSKWLSFMEERLVIARNLLIDDGIFLVSIDDNEGHQLKLLCDEIFGETNFIGSFAVIKAEGGGMAKHLVKGHDMLFLYAKNINNRFPLARPKDIRGKIVEMDGIDYWIQEDAIRKTFGQYGNLHYEEILDYRDDDFKKKIDEGIKNKEYILVEKDNGMHVIGKLRRVDEDYSKFYSVIKHLNAEGVKELETMGLSEIFDYPKPTSLVQELIEGATFLKKEKYIILDFFAGFRVIIVIEANSYVNTRSSRLLPKFKTQKINSWCAA